MLTHPGPADPQRVQIVPCRAHPLRLWLQPGVALDRAIADAVAAAGFDAAWLWLRDLPCTRLAYVIPAPPPGDGRVAFYSDTRVLAPSGGAYPWIAHAGMHLGHDAAGPALHAHGLWQDAAGVPHMGHLRPEDSQLAQAVQVTGWGLDCAAFHRRPDPETGFALFEPRATPQMREGGLPARLLRLRPHLDLAPTLRALKAPATSVAGLGSLIGTVFDDAPALPGPATEILILNDDPARLRVASVGADGHVRQGWLSGVNPVCITAELLLVEGGAP